MATTDDDYRPWTEEEWDRYENMMDDAMERAAEEHYAREREEYEKRRPLIEREIAQINESPPLLPAPWVRDVKIRDEYPTDGYGATAGPFSIVITPGFVDDEDGGWSVWDWSVVDWRLAAQCGDDDPDIRKAAREALSCCRIDFDPAPEAEDQLAALEAALKD
jgi:hypothetical protein